MTDNELHLFCLQWLEWKRTRKFFAPPSLKPGILARMQPGKVNAPPNAECSAEMAHFDLAIRALPDTAQKLAFLLFYRFPRPGPIKTIAGRMEITPKTFYAYVKRTRREAYGLSQRFRAIQNEEAEQCSM